MTFKLKPLAEVMKPVVLSEGKNIFSVSIDTTEYDSQTARGKDHLVGHKKYLTPTKNGDGWMLNVQCKYVEETFTTYDDPDTEKDNRGNITLNYSIWIPTEDHPKYNDFIEQRTEEVGNLLRAVAGLSKKDFLEQYGDRDPDPEFIEEIFGDESHYAKLRIKYVPPKDNFGEKNELSYPSPLSEEELEESYPF